VQVKTAYRKLCLQHHPDLFQGQQRGEAEARFRTISDAYNRLHSGVPVCSAARATHSQPNVLPNVEVLQCFRITTMTGPAIMRRPNSVTATP
jgi:DnaJ domain